MTASEKAGPKGSASVSNVASSGDAGAPRVRKPRVPAKLHGMLSYWADETLPQLADLLEPAKIEPVEFATWLAPRIGDFRGDQSIRASTPSRSEELDALAAFRRDALATLERLNPLWMPPIAAAHVHLLASKTGHDFTELVRCTRDSLLSIQALVGAVEREFKKLPSKAGRKSARGRDRLAADVFEKVRALAPQLSVADARELAKEILLRCGTPAPDDLKRSVKKGQK